MPPKTRYKDLVAFTIQITRDQREFALKECAKRGISRAEWVRGLIDGEFSRIQLEKRDHEKETLKVCGLSVTPLA